MNNEAIRKPSFNQADADVISQRRLTALSFLLVMIVVVLLIAAIIGLRNASTTGLYLVGGLLAVSLGGAIFIWPELGTYVLAVTVFTNLSAHFTDSGLPSINKPLVVLIAVSLLANRLLSKRVTFKLRRVETLMILYGAVLLLSSFFAVDRGIALGDVIDYAKEIIILIVVVYSLESPRSWQNTGWIILGTIGLLTLLGAYQILTGNFEQSFFGLATVRLDSFNGSPATRLNGPIGDPNFYGQLLAAMMPLAIYRVIDEEKMLPKLGGVVLVGLILFNLINTFSRGAFLALAAGLVFIALERKVRIEMAAILLVLVVLFYPLLPKDYRERIASLNLLTSNKATATYADESIRGRTAEFRAGLQMWADHPLLGVGYSNYENVYQEYAPRVGLEYRTEEREAHSIYIEAAAETGLLGLVTLVGVFIATLAGLGEARRKLKTMEMFPHWQTWLASLQIGIASYLISSIFLQGDFLRFLWFMIALAVASMHIVSRLWDSEMKPLREEIILAAKS
jgi:putative inorganic carbon (HCO3(-)) transporter